MTPRTEMEAAQVLETLGEFIAALAALAAKVPAKSAASIPGGIRPTEEAVESYETIVYRFRDRAGSTYRVLNQLFMDSLEAFETGKIFDAVPPLLQAIEQVVELHKEGKGPVSSRRTRSHSGLSTTPGKASSRSEPAGSGPAHTRDLLTISILCRSEPFGRKPERPTFIPRCPGCKPV